jgi:hypothetical protein
MGAKMSRLRKALIAFAVVVVTDVLVRQNGTWVIRHTHTSARRQRPGGTF